jgi:pimeloyl-ACP methyl ester carboxylesterase
LGAGASWHPGPRGTGMTSKPQAPRRYGRAPFATVVVHGGPGAPGSMAPVAQVLGARLGVLEPWQTARTVSGQVQELSDQIDAWASPPVALVGHSWGAWLVLLVAGEHPEKVRQVVLVGSGPFQVRYAAEVYRHRRKRLTRSQWQEFVEIEHRLADPLSRTPPSALRRLGELAEIADSYELLPHPPAEAETDTATFRSVWTEADEMRKSGALVRALRHVKAPIVVLHGTADPHPLQGVVEPLRRAGVDPRVIVLERCGHEPWWERYARDSFFVELQKELTRS